MENKNYSKSNLNNQKNIKSEQNLPQNEVFKSNANISASAKNKSQKKQKQNIFKNYFEKFKQIFGLNNAKKSAEQNVQTNSLNKNQKNKTKIIFKSTKTNAVVAVAMVFAITVLSVCSVLLAGNWKINQTLTANVANTRIVQAKLAELGYYNQSIDGIFDNDTIEAVKNYQQDNNLAVTGALDQSTTTALGVTDNTQANTDLYLLAKLIHSEARGEVYEGQVAVGAVVLNRVRDAGFPNTIQGVIYQPWAFTALNDGQFALEPNSTAYSAAQDAMNGWDPTYGCIFYYNPATATSSWIFSREIIVRIGNHVFCI